MPSTGASRAAALSGSSTDGGVAKTDCSSTEVASSTPVASVISPRSAGICSCWASWFTAMAASGSRSTICHHASRVPIPVATTAATSSRSRARARLSVLASNGVLPTPPGPGGVIGSLVSVGRWLGEGDGARRQGHEVATCSWRACSITAGDRASPIWKISCCCSARSSASCARRSVDLVADRGHVAGLAQMEEREARRGGDADEHAGHSRRLAAPPPGARSTTRLRNRARARRANGRGSRTGLPGALR